MTGAPAPSRDAAVAAVRASRGDNTALRRTADRDGLAAELRIVTLFHGRVERIHIDVDDLAMRRRRGVLLRIA